MRALSTEHSNDMGSGCCRVRSDATRPDSWSKYRMVHAPQCACAGFGACRAHGPPYERPRVFWPAAGKVTSRTTPPGLAACSLRHPEQNACLAAHFHRFLDSPSRTPRSAFAVIRCATCIINSARPSITLVWSGRSRSRAMAGESVPVGGADPKESRWQCADGNVRFARDARHAAGRPAAPGCVSSSSLPISASRLSNPTRPGSVSRRPSPLRPSALANS